MSPSLTRISTSAMSHEQGQVVAAMGEWMRGSAARTVEPVKTAVPGAGVAA
jgi:hypothetical protein